jgi:two-component system, chemotaxis family, chemotaxis protein CheY
MFSPDIKILVIDDMKAVRQLLKFGLKKIGFSNVLDAEDGQIALNMLNESKTKSPFELIISDWNMPGLTGLELLRVIRSDEVYKDIPFIMLTAEAEQNAILSAVQEKVSNYIIKPFSPDILEEKLKQVYKRHFG